jgi:dihydroflavonol-4-reductase
MRVAITGGAGFIGRAIVERLAARGDEVIALVRDRRRAGHIIRPGVTLAPSDLSDPAELAEQMRGADGVIHSAGSYRIGIKPSERDAMWDANVGATERVLDAAVVAGAKRIVYVSTNNVFGDTRGELVDETYRRDLSAGFLSWYDETKYRAHEAAEARIARGAPIVIVQPGQTYGPHDHSQASEQLQLAFAGKLPYVAFPSTGMAWVHVDDLADAIVAALDRGRVGEAYSLAGDPQRLAAAVALASRAGGRRAPRLAIPTAVLRAIAPLSDRLGGLPGLPANLRETISAAEDVTYWANHDKATAELGFRPRSLEQGIADTWARA